MLRQEDLLAAAAEVIAQQNDRPVMVLMHHHLIPTPITDYGSIDVRDQGTFTRWIIGTALPWLVANADREELSMTALGAGTALTTLHTLGRPVLVLHGHKHYPTVRLLRGIYEGHGDVLLASAGSAGLAERWRLTEHDLGVPLWPSFNVVDLDGDDVRVTTVSYPTHVESGELKTVQRPMLRARREGMEWRHIDRVTDRTPMGNGPRLALNRSVFELDKNADLSCPRWDARVRRTLRRAPGHQAPGEYEEVVEGALGAVLKDVRIGGAEQPDLPCPAKIELPLEGDSSYRLVGGLCGTVAQAIASYDSATPPYEWVALLNRYGCDSAELLVTGLPDGIERVFGSAVDLTTGLERSLPVRVDGDSHVIVEQGCPPRTLLRIFWSLSR
jgi:hypothetical protein